LKGILEEECLSGHKNLVNIFDHRHMFIKIRKRK
jgi:NAD-specific glutamate dehydrogenase